MFLRTFFWSCCNVQASGSQRDPPLFQACTCFPISSMITPHSWLVFMSHAITWRINNTHCVQILQHLQSYKQCLLAFHYLGRKGIANTKLKTERASHNTFIASFDNWMKEIPQMSILLYPHAIKPILSPTRSLIENIKRYSVLRKKYSQNFSH